MKKEKTFKDFVKVVRLGGEKQGGRKFSVFCKIVYRSGNLSITGVEGPLADGGCIGACGQIIMHLKADYFNDYAPGWGKDKIIKFLEVWAKWHLKDMVAGCGHQRDLDFLYNLPDADTKPAWI